MLLDIYVSSFFTYSDSIGLFLYYYYTVLETINSFFIIIIISESIRDSLEKIMFQIMIITLNLEDVFIYQLIPYSFMLF